jgi:hypothetical protein
LRKRKVAGNMMVAKLASRPVTHCVVRLAVGCLEFLAFAFNRTLVGFLIVVCLSFWYLHVDLSINYA